jgi:hypothetical protein
LYIGDDGLLAAGPGSRKSACDQRCFSGLVGSFEQNHAILRIDREMHQCIDFTLDTPCATTSGCRSSPGPSEDDPAMATGAMRRQPRPGKVSMIVG